MAKNHRIHVRIGDAGSRTIGDLMAAHEATESLVVRAMLAVASQHPAEVDQRIRELREAGS